VLEGVIAEGATTINFPDTVGYAVPEIFGETIRRLRERIPNSDKAIWSVHCHNDLVAVANSLAGVMIGGAVRSSAPSTAWANVPVTRRWKKW
jgi:2-isopropylmalate synthase